MWLMLQEEKPDDYVIATGETHSVRELVEHAGSLLGYDIAWRGEGLEEEGFDKESGKVLISIDKKYYRPSEVDILQGDATKAKQKLNWEPKVKFKNLIKLMMEEEFNERGLLIKDYLK